MSPTGTPIGSNVQVADCPLPHWVGFPEASCHERPPARGMLVMYTCRNFTGVAPVFLTSTSTFPIQVPVVEPEIWLFPVPHHPLVPYFAVPFTTLPAMTIVPFWSRSRLPTTLLIIWPRSALSISNLPVI